MKNSVLTIIVFFIAQIFVAQADELEDAKAPPELDPALQKQWPRADAPNQSPIEFNEMNLTAPGPENEEFDAIKKAAKNRTCATFNYKDIGLSCLRHSGSRSSCVWASGWGWTFFNNYETWCAGTTLTVCYKSRGPCG